VADFLAHLEPQYEILGKLGEGGMGTLFKVRHRLLREVRVVKMMRDALKGDEELAARFLHEARMASSPMTASMQGASCPHASWPDPTYTMRRAVRSALQPFATA
jgi:serine/threonine protein kinase